MIAQGKGRWRSGGPMMGRTYAFPHHRPRAASRRGLGLMSLPAWWMRRREDL